MSSKSKARLPARAVDLDPDRVLAAGGEPGRLEDADCSAAEAGEEGRGVVDGDLAEARSAVPSAATQEHAAVPAGERALVDEGLEQPVDGDDVLSPVMCWVRSTMWAPMSPSAPEPALSFSSRQVIGDRGSASQSWRYCARTCRISPMPALLDQLAGQRDRRAPGGR